MSLLKDENAGLVVSRFQDEELVIYDRDTYEVLAVVKLVEPRADKARLGIRALDSIGTDRREVFERKLADLRRVTDRSPKAVKGAVKPTAPPDKTIAPTRNCSKRRM